MIEEEKIRVDGAWEKTKPFRKTYYDSIGPYIKIILTMEGLTEPTRDQLLERHIELEKRKRLIAISPDRLVLNWHQMEFERDWFVMDFEQGIIGEMLRPLSRKEEKKYWTLMTKLTTEKDLTQEEDKNGK